jgi:Polysaccharide deacetylase
LALRRAALRLTLGILLAFLGLAGAAQAQTVVSLTFDDGIATQMLVRSTLQSHGMHATFFLNSGNVGVNSYYMTWANVATLNTDGNATIGATCAASTSADAITPEWWSKACVRFGDSGRSASTMVGLTASPRPMAIRRSRCRASSSRDRWAAGRSTARLTASRAKRPIAVGVAQSVELLVVVQAVAGSNPVAHPSAWCFARA